MMKRYRKWSGSGSRMLVEKVVVTATVVALFLATPALATVKDLGTVGRTYPVVEPDGLAEIQQPSERMKEFQEEMLAERVKNYQPADLHPLPRTTTEKTFLVDMTYTLDRDLSDADGKVIYPKGYTFNPLDYTTLSGALVVIDGNDPAQLKWFEASPYFKNHQARLLLSNGQVAALTKALQRSVFYLTEDIAKRLHLGAVPSVVIQKGHKVQVMEFSVPRNNPGKPR